MTSHKKTHNEHCTIAKTQLFKQGPIQNDLIAGTWEKINRIDAGQGSKTVKFIIKGTDQYIDLAASYLELKLKITKADGTNLDANAEIAPVNLIGSAIFSQIKVFLKNIPVLTQQNYDVASVVQTESTYSKLSKETWLGLHRYHKDTAGQHNTLGDANLGFKARKNIFAGSASVQVMSRIHCSLFSQEKLLLNNLDLEIEFDRQKEEKCIMAAAGTSCKLHIEKAVLHTRKITLSNETNLKIQNKLLKKAVVYEIPRYFIFTQTVQGGGQNTEIRNFNLGTELPTKMLVFLTDESAYTGNLNENPFNFKHFNLHKFDILANGQSIYGNGIECNFVNDEYLELYMATMRSLGHLDGDGCDISLHDYGRGYALFGGDLTPSLCDGDVYTDPIKTGTLEINMQFDVAIPNTMTVLVYCEYDCAIRIDHNRDVIKDFA